MNSRALRILAILWLFGWFGMYLPGHQRGSVQLPGSGGEQESCCPAPTASAAPSCHMPASTDDSEDSDDEPGPPSNCALCQIINTLFMPGDIILGPEPAGVLTVLSDPAGSTRPMSHPVRLALGRAPPAFLISL